MTCDEAELLLQDDLGGRLDAGRRQQLDEHLASCSACRETAVAQTDVSRVLASRPDAPVRADFAARLAGEIDRQSGWLGLADWHWLSVRLAPLAALLLLAAGIVVEREATRTSSRASLSTVVETWASDDSGATPVTAVLWQPQANEDTAVLTVLAAPSDATIVSQANER